MRDIQFSGDVFDLDTEQETQLQSTPRVTWGRYMQAFGKHDATNDDRTMPFFCRVLSISR